MRFSNKDGNIVPYLDGEEHTADWGAESHRHTSSTCGSKEVPHLAYGDAVSSQVPPRYVKIIL